MDRLRLVKSGVLLFLAASACGQVSVRRPVTLETVKPRPIPAKPAVLIVRVTDLPDRSARRVEVVEPRGAALPRDLPLAAGPVEYPGDYWPTFGPEYELARTWRPNPDDPHVQYLVYTLDLHSPSSIDNWRDLQRARRAEQRAARNEWLNERDARRRNVRLSGAHAEAIHEGLALMEAGKYREAIVPLTRAADLNHADPGCRIHLAQARLAVGHDAEAAQALRRALELQPKLVPMRLDLQQYYPDAADFEAQIDALAARLNARPLVPADEYLLLGFFEFQRGRLDAAHAAFRQAARGLPRNDIVWEYLAITKPVARQPEQPVEEGRWLRANPPSR